MSYLEIARENRELMVKQGLHPEMLRRYLLQTHELQVRNFNIIKGTLSQRDQDQIETMLLQGELMLLKVCAACEAAKFGNLSLKLEDL